MKSGLISIIVPVYNVEQYLNMCVQSILNQTFSNIEIILVNDGSTDRSGVICDKYLKYENVKVIHKTNTGVSDTRNCGIDIACGEYIMFVDSDDYLHPKACELLYNKIVKDKSDIVFGRYKKVNFNENQSFNQINIEDSLSQIKSIDQVVESILSFEYPEGINAVAKLFKTTVIKDNRFMIGYPLGEDQEFIFSILANCNTVSFIDDIIYFYVFREDSAGHKKINMSNERKLHELYSYILKKHDYLIVVKEKLYLFACVQSNLNSLNKMIICNSYDDKLIEALRTDLKRKSKVFLKAKGYNLKKIQLLFAAYFWNLYKHLFSVLK